MCLISWVLALSADEREALAVPEVPEDRRLALLVYRLVWALWGLSSFLAVSSWRSIAGNLRTIFS